jgi:hypothetical protein
VRGASSKLDRATRASPEPASGLGHSASVPSAVEVTLNILTSRLPHPRADMRFIAREIVTALGVRP